MIEKGKPCLAARLRAFLSHGRQTTIVSFLNNSYREAYKDMQRCGCEFQIEMLSTAQLSITISDGDDDIDAEITLSGSWNAFGEIRGAVEKMLERAAWIKKKSSVSEKLQLLWNMLGHDSDDAIREMLNEIITQVDAENLEDAVNDALIKEGRDN